MCLIACIGEGLCAVERLEAELAEATAEGCEEQIAEKAAQLEEAKQEFEREAAEAVVAAAQGSHSDSHR